MESEKVKKAADIAAALAQDVPAEFRGFAFQVLFARILESDSSRSAVDKVNARTNQNGRIYEQNRDEMIQAILQANVDFSQFHELITSGSWVDRVMLILWIIEDQVGIDSLTPPEIATIMTDKLRLPSVYPPNIGRAITSNMAYFVRAQEGKAYRYSLSSKGISQIERLIEKAGKR